MRRFGATRLGRGEKEAKRDMKDVQPARRGIPPAMRFLLVAALLALCCAGTALAAGSSASDAAKKHPPKLAGKWEGHYSGAYTGTFTLQWKRKGANLDGTIKLSSPKGKYTVSGSVHGTKIKFGAVGAGATYTGKWKGKSMSGKWKIPGGGGSWSASKG
jgi:hypothetical protein